MDYGIKDKVAVVTGAAGDGLGRADAMALAAEGAKVAVIDIRSCDETVKLLKEQGATAAGYECDLSDEAQVRDTVKKIQAELGDVSILVNNASILSTIGMFEQIPTKNWNRDVEVNVMGTANITRAVWPMMLKNKWGRVVCMASIAGTHGGAGQSSYSTTKSAMIGFGKSLALEGARSNITANVIAPGVIKSEIVTGGLMREDMLKRMSNATAMRRFGEMSELAHVVVFLCSEQSSYLTGQVIHVDGGMGLFVF
jgi:NAD(P)-dependent dehydrogenase (short-subunit alcohol dehydrogenase family)